MEGSRAGTAPLKTNNPVRGLAAYRTGSKYDWRIAIQPVIVKRPVVLRFTRFSAPFQSTITPIFLLQHFGMMQTWLETPANRRRFASARRCGPDRSLGEVLSSKTLQSVKHETRFSGQRAIDEQSRFLRERGCSKWPQRSTLLHHASEHDFPVSPTFYGSCGAEKRFCAREVDLLKVHARPRGPHPHGSEPVTRIWVGLSTKEPPYCKRDDDELH